MEIETAFSLILWEGAMTKPTNETIFHFSVDGISYHSRQQFVTGAEIRQLAGIAPRLRLFLGEPGDEHGHSIPDRQVLRDTRVDLSRPGEEKFYTLQPPSMDIC